jgi:hypothetical protein
MAIKKAFRGMPPSLLLTGCLIILPGNNQLRAPLVDASHAFSS